MAQANTQFITSRRNSSFGHLASRRPALLSIPIVTAPTACERIEELKGELSAALRDYYGDSVQIVITDTQTVHAGGTPITQDDVAPAPI